jgi:hypothetical protein
MSAAGRTFTGDLPDSWRRAWRAQYLAQCRTKGSILQPVAPLTAEQQRTLRFGPAWGWWSVPDDERRQWWERDGQEARG